jgi:hypothetical protein
MSSFVASITILQHIPAHLNQISYATSTIIHHSTHAPTCPHITHKTSTALVTPTGLIILLILIDYHNRRSHAQNKYTFHVDTYRCIPQHIIRVFFKKILSSQQTTHQIHSYRNLKISDPLSNSFSFATNFNPYQYSFYTYTHMHNIDQSLNRLIHKIPSEHLGRIEASHMGCPQGLAFR